MNELAVMRRHTLRPQRTQHSNPLLDDMGASLGRTAVVGELFAVPAPADTEHQTASAQRIERRDRMGELDRVVLADERHCSTDLQ